MSEIPDNNAQEMSTFAYALLENYEVFGNTEDEYEIGTRDKLIQYIGGLESKVAELEVEIAETRCDEIDALNNRIAELEEFIGKLIEVGHKSVNFVEGFCNTYGNERPKYWHDWKALEDDWKEREE